MGRKREPRRGVWQPRFWEHTLESDDDFERHFDDCHDIPVKHGNVVCPRDWMWLTFHRRGRAGVYPPHWACVGRRPFAMNFDDIAHRVGDHR
jgi:putative transposase